MNTPITRTSILINATIEEVWDAITKPELVKQYFFGTDLVTTWEVGTSVCFKGSWEGKEYEEKGVVQTCVPFQSLSYTFESDEKDGSDVAESHKHITYEIVPKDTGVEVSICQTAETEEEAKKSEQNWSLVLDGMKKMLESQS